MFGLYLLPKGMRNRKLVYKFEPMNDTDESFVEYTYKKLFGRLYVLVRVVSYFDENSPEYVVDCPDALYLPFV